MKKIKILIADDHSVVRIGLSALLSSEPDFDVVGQAKNGRAAVAEAARLRPDIVIMDLMMPVMDGIEATAQIKAKFPEAKVIILTTFSTSDGIVKALESGATGAIFKSAADTDLIKAIRQVSLGKTVISSDIRRLIKDDPPISDLSTRQSEILASIGRGLSNTEIATQLGITPTVVREHTLALFQKLGAANRAEAVGIAMRKHLLKI